MALKFLIVVLFISLVVSLTSGLIFLLKDIQSDRKRGLYALGIRITLASLLMAVIFYGLYTGQLGSSAPWDKIATKEQLELQIKPE